MTEQKGTFEERLQSVQDIITRIEEGKLPLEDSVKQFENGMQILAQLDEELKGMNRRLTVLKDGYKAEHQAFVGGVNLNAVMAVLIGDGADVCDLPIDVDTRKRLFFPVNLFVNGSFDNVLGHCGEGEGQ